jgi:hypothetical protein
VKVERDIKVQGKVQMKMIIPKPEKVKRLLLLQHKAQVPEEEDPEELTEMNPSNPLQTQPEIGNDYYYAASAVSSNAHHQYTEAPLFSIDRLDKPVPNAAQTLEDQHFEEPESQEPYLDCLTQSWHRQIHPFARQLEEYSDEAHLTG